MTNIPSHLQAILDQARWSPSGDNTQPWRFEILSGEHILVHGFDTRDHVVYDLDGHASQLSIGALLETMRVAASTLQLGIAASRRTDTPETHLLIDVHLAGDVSLSPDILAESIEKRVVQRRAMSTRPLTGQEKLTLEQNLPQGYQVLWFESLAQRWKLAKFMFDNAKVRLTIPEAFAVHRQIIEWGARFSQDRIPEQAVGVDAMTARLMQWAMASWTRMQFMNTYLLGHLPPRIQLDLIPGVFCAAHFALLAPKPLTEIDDYIAAGGVMQRFWLNATRLGLLIQPEMTPVIFSRYHRQGRKFTQVAHAERMAADLNARLTNLLAGQDVNRLYFMGRMGKGPLPRARSIRKPLDQLIEEMAGKPRTSDSGDDA